MRKERYVVLLEGRDAVVYLKNGSVHKGSGNILCLGSNQNGEDVDAILFTTEDGDMIITEDEIDKVVFID